MQNGGLSIYMTKELRPGCFSIHLSTLIRQSFEFLRSFLPQDKRLNNFKFPSFDAFTQKDDTSTAFGKPLPKVCKIIFHSRAS